MPTARAGWAGDRLVVLGFAGARGAGLAWASSSMEIPSTRTGRSLFFALWMAERRSNASPLRTMRRTLRLASPGAGSR
jgi:hypothetical protein